MIAKAVKQAKGESMTKIPEPVNHELIWGPTGSGKTTLVKKRLADDQAGGAEAWVIDPHGGVSLPEWEGKAARYARDLGEIKELLTAAWQEAEDRGRRIASLGLGGWTPGDARLDLPLLVLTVEEASAVLQDRSCRFAMERILRMA